MFGDEQRNGTEDARFSRGVQTGTACMRNRIQETTMVPTIVLLLMWQHRFVVDFVLHIYNANLSYCLSAQRFWSAVVAERVVLAV